MDLRHYHDNHRTHVPEGASVGGGSSPEAALLWVLNLSYGEQALLDIADRSGLVYPTVQEAAEELRAHGLLAEVEGG
jgi:aminopeptidase-like protein